MKKTFFLVFVENWKHSCRTATGWATSQARCGIRRSRSRAVAVRRGGSAHAATAPGTVVDRAGSAVLCAVDVGACRHGTGRVRHKKIPDRDTQAWESKAQSLWSLKQQKEILDKSPFLKRCHGRKPPCTVIGCDGRHGTRATAGTGGSGGGGGGAGSSGRGATQAPDARRLQRARQGPNHPARSWTWDQLKAWLRALTNKEPRHKSQDAALAAVLKKWDPAQHDNKPAPLVPTSTSDSDDEDEAGDDVAADPPLSDAEDDDADVFFDA